MPVVTDELLRQRNTCLTKATNIIMVPTRIRFLITPLLSAWHCGPNIGFASGGGGGGGGIDAINRLFMKGVRLSVSVLFFLLHFDNKKQKTKKQKNGFLCFLPAEDSFNDVILS